MEKDERLGKYLIKSELAHSNIATVYRAFEESLGRPVLIKKLHPQMAREDDIRMRFEREAKVCAQVKHDNIVQVYGFHAEPELTMLVLEFVEGRSLAELAAGEAHMPWRIALSILHGVLQGLSFAHSKGVIHRDIKPDNILISDEGQVKITDFGLATIEDAPKLTRQGTVVGTPAYMPPEQISGSKIDMRGDLFSLGATFYEILTGATPFYGENFSEIMKKILNAYPQKPSAVVSDIPSELDQIILRLIEKQPIRRYATAGQALQDVKNLSDQRNVALGAEPIRSYMNSVDAKPVESKLQTSSHNIQAPLQRRFSEWYLGLIGSIVILSALLLPSGRNIQNRSKPGYSNELNQSIQRMIAMNSLQNMLDSQAFSEGGKIDIDLFGAENFGDSRALDNVSKRNLSKAATSIIENPSDEEASTLPGRVFINSKPWARITIDNKTFGQTPLTEPIELSPGEHQFVFDNDEFPSPVVETVMISAGKEHHVDLNLWGYFAVIQILSVKPWAEIYIDDVSYGQTPLARPIILQLGEHVIELRNPAFQTWRQQMIFGRDQPPVEISATLIPLEKVREE